MATTKGILGQALPTANTLTDIYSVPEGKTATVKVIITNQSGAGVTVRVAAAYQGAADANQHYVAYDKAIAANETGSTAVFMLNSGDVVRVYCSATVVSFTCTGIERDQ